MIILHTVKGRCNPDSANGVDKTIYYLSRAQAAAGHEVHMLSEADKLPIDIPGVKVHRVDPWKGCFTIPKKIKRLIDEVKPDVVHFHSAYIPTSVGIARYLRSSDIPYVVTPNGNCSSRLMRRRPWFKIPYKLIFERPYMNKALFVHSVGDGEAIMEYGIKVPVIDAPNGIDLETVPAQLETDLIISKYPEWKGRKIFVFVGRLDIQQKGLDRLLDSLALCDGRAQKQLGVLLVGPDWQGSKEILEKKAESLGLGNLVKFFGAAHGKEKFDLMASADCFLYPSRWEGMPFAVIEAMATNQLCMVTPAADPGGWLAKSDAGVVVEPTEKSILEGLLRVCQLSEDVRNDYITRSATLVREKFTWDVIAKTVTDGYVKYGSGKQLK